MQKNVTMSEAQRLKITLAHRKRSLALFDQKAAQDKADLEAEIHYLTLQLNRLSPH